MVIEDIKKTFEAVIGQLSPAKAQELAKRYLEPGAAKEQVAKAAGDLIELSQRLRDAVRKEVTSQMRSMGAATQDELDSLRKRVRDLERAAGMTASGGTKAARKSGARKPGARKPTSRKKTTARRTSSKTTPSRRKTSSAR
jgi:polyhydroxyalkanoate synthesis regulator phasin